MQVILDISANTHQNDPDVMREIFRSIWLGGKHRRSIVVKTQLWCESNPQGNNEKTTVAGLRSFIKLARESGFEATSSVFDAWSLKKLLAHNVPFVKIACQSKLARLAERVPRGVPVYRSCNRVSHKSRQLMNKYDRELFCIPKYPAKQDKYNIAIQCGEYSISDHTVGLGVFNALKELSSARKIYECHYVLERNDTNPDAGPFAKTPEDLREMFA